MDEATSPPPEIAESEDSISDTPIPTWKESSDDEDEARFTHLLMVTLLDSRFHMDLLMVVAAHLYTRSHIKDNTLARPCHLGLPMVVSFYFSTAKPHTIYESRPFHQPTKSTMC